MSTRLEQQAMRDWVVAKEHDTFCTLKFRNGYDIDEQQAERIVQVFLQQVDRVYWGNLVHSQNVRCPRFVFKQRGISRQNTHFHIVMQSEGDMYTFLQILRKTWARFTESCSTTSRFEKARDTTATGTYCIHEWAYLGSDTFCANLSHTDKYYQKSFKPTIHRTRRLLTAI